MAKAGAKRAAIFSGLLQNKILADYHRELLGELARLAYETVHEMMAAAIDVDVNDARPGMVAVIQTFGSSLRCNPHIHAIVTRGVLLDDGSWQPLPYVDADEAPPPRRVLRVGEILSFRPASQDRNPYQ